jgi:hypothetical protein
VILSSLGLRFKRWHYFQQLHETKPPDHAITQEASAELFITATATMLEQTNKSSQKTDKNAADIGLNPSVDLYGLMLGSSHQSNSKRTVGKRPSFSHRHHPICMSA